MIWIDIRPPQFLDAILLQFYLIVGVHTHGVRGILWPANAQSALLQRVMQSLSK